MTRETPHTTITLRALEGEPLRDAAIQRMVVSTAHAIGERQGVKVINVDTTTDSITITIGTGRIAAWGFAAELRRLTDEWYRHKRDGMTLWGKPKTHESGTDGADWWKRANVDDEDDVSAS